MIYKFIDIGCSHWGVSSEIFGTDVRGMFVEPIKVYLDMLPIGPNIQKVNAAIYNYDGDVTFNAVIDHNAEYTTMDDVVMKYMNKQTGNIGSNGLSSLFKIQHKVPEQQITVHCMTLQTLCATYDVTEIDYLKIDVEGYEYQLLTQLSDLLDAGTITINNEIKFEFNRLSDKESLMQISDKIASNHGFVSQFVKLPGWQEDIVMTKK